MYQMPLATMKFRGNSILFGLARASRSPLPAQRIQLHGFFDALAMAVHWGNDLFTGMAFIKQVDDRDQPISSSFWPTHRLLPCTYDVGSNADAADATMIEKRQLLPRSG
jgi:hypothetical protein